MTIPPRIIFLSNDVGALGGITRVMETLTTSFEDRGIAVSFVSRDPGSPILGHAPFVVNRGVTWTTDNPLTPQFPGRFGWKLRSKQAITPLWRVWRTARLGFYLRRCERNTVLIFFKPHLHSVYSHLPKRLRRRFVVIEQFHSNPDGLAAHGWLDIYRSVRSTTDRFLALDHPTATSMQASIEAPVGWIENPWPRPTVSAAPVGNRDRSIVVLSRLSGEKRLHVLIEAFASARANVDDNWSLTIYGEGPDRARLQALIDTLDLTSSIKLPGSTSRPYEAFANASLTAVTSAFEAGPLTIVEACSVGTPAVCTPCSPLVREMIPSTGWLALETGNESHEDLVRAVSDALTLAMNDPIERERRSQAGMAFVQRNDPDRIAAEWLALVESLQQHADTTK